MTVEQFKGVQEVLAWEDERHRSERSRSPRAAAREFLTSHGQFPLTSEQVSEILRVYAGVLADADYL